MYPGSRDHGIVLQFVGQPVALDRYALQKKESMKLLKEDIVRLLRIRKVTFKKSDKKRVLFEALLRDACSDLGEEEIQTLLAWHTAAESKTEDQKMSEKLGADKNLSDALDMLGSMDFESAQAFPELAKVQKMRRNPELQQKLETPQKQHRVGRRARRRSKSRSSSSSSNGGSISNEDQTLLELLVRQVDWAPWPLRSFLGPCPGNHEASGVNDLPESG
jgi:hypothetical protein